MSVSTASYILDLSDRVLKKHVLKAGAPSDDEDGTEFCKVDTNVFLLFTRSDCFDAMDILLILSD